MGITYNRVIVAGNLTRDPEVKFLPSGTSVTKFAIAVNERIKKGDRYEDVPSFFDVTAFGKMGENCAEYLSKGRPALVEGKLRQRRWEQDGAKRSAVEIVADNVQFLGSKEAAPASAPPASEDIPF